MMGGLGNQLFQFAAGRRLAIRHGAELVLDLGWFRHEGRGVVPVRSYQLGALDLNARVTRVHPRALAAFESGRRRGLRRRKLEVIRQRDGDFGVDRRVLNASDDVLLIGYWQSEEYFADVAGAVRQELGIATRPVSAQYAVLDRLVDRSSAVAVHVRRGDYVSNPRTHAFHGVLDRDYYRRALDYVRGRRTATTLLGFSDDPDWVERELAADLGLTVVRGGDALQELRLMSRCAHHVVANSSFSWWGAWLGERDDSLVVAPQRWFADPRADTRSIVPERWRRL
jgi:hypothetical protein